MEKLGGTTVTLSRFLGRSLILSTWLIVAAGGDRIACAQTPDASKEAPVVTPSDAIDPARLPTADQQGATAPVDLLAKSGQVAVTAQNTGDDALSLTRDPGVATTISPGELQPSNDGDAVNQNVLGEAPPEQAPKTLT